MNIQELWRARRRAIAALSLAAMAAGCGGASLPRLSFWSSEPTELKSPRLVGATIYGCDGGKQLAVRYAGPGQPAMVIFPEREFRLDPSPGAAGRYSNGRTTLAVNGDDATLDEAGAVVLANCRRAAPAK